MRVGFFGGTFDPPHRGHVAIAEAALDRLHLDRILVTPVGVQPLKRGVRHTDFQDRLAMVELVCAGDPRLVPSGMDAPRADGRPNYTYETLLQVRRELAPGDELFFLMGADAFATLKQWHRAAEMLCLCDQSVAGRPGASLEKMCEFLPEGVRCEEVESRPGLIVYELHGGCTEGRRLYAMPDLNYEVSATELRAALAEGTGGGPLEQREALLDPAVAAYVREHGLYPGDRGVGRLRVTQRNG